MSIKKIKQKIESFIYYIVNLKNTFPYEDGMWPSFLRQIEMKVLSNCLFRVAACVPMAIRIFVAIVIW